MDATPFFANLKKEASCPVCLGYFQDPVSTPCGHNFCRACIAQCWEEVEGDASYSCPECGENNPLRNSSDNQHLARIAETVQCWHREAAGVQDREEQRLCEKHQELLRIFCKDDKIQICLLCEISREHRHHTVIPVEEAAQDYKFQMELKTLRQRRDKLQTLKIDEERRSRQFLERLGNEGKRVVSEFKLLHQFLGDQEQLLLAKMEQLENELIKEKKAITFKLSEEISNLSDLISEIEEKCSHPANEFLQDLTNILNRCEHQKIQQPMEHHLDLEKRLNAFSEESMNLEEIRKKFKDALPSELKSPSLLKHALGTPKGRRRLFDLPFAEVAKRTGRRVNVTLDPDTANPFLILSADQKSVRLGDIWQDVSDSPERFDTYPCVLGCEGFISGRHYWEVEVGSGRYWAVGFAKESVRRKGEIIPSPEEQIWALQQYGDYFEALTYPVTTLSLNSWPRRIQVFLDYEEDQVAFFDADTAALIYVFSSATFGQERFLPWLWVWPGTELRLYQ
ncbi:zinc finger protein RFP-like isoform X2 [Sphaerodactylus townsendi]|uniref:zinc finger protein RFP-like isoform X2 n=1 Tax=Sphaerodactylus townsendi TaxID=933632 RepID=UPI002026595D|nr:zinc finger protein RFP-like isoform X2 [Sphaerodactylus townsendi]